MKQFTAHVRFFFLASVFACNGGAFAQGDIAAPVFSHPSGFYQEAFTLELSAAEPGDVIIYTLDGSVPLPDHIGGMEYTYKNQYPNSPGDPFGDTLISQIETFVYDSSLNIYDRSSEPDRVSQKSSTNDLVPDYIPNEPSFKGTSVRARVFREGTGMSAVVSRTFFVTPEGSDRYHIPVIALAANENGLYGYEEGIANAGITFDQARINFPNMQNIPHWRNNYRRSGAEWELQSQFALILPGQDTAILDHECGLRLHGSSSRRWPRKSFRIYSRSDYGASKFEHQFFSEQTDNSFNRLILHNGGGDQPRANMRDAVGQRILRPMGLQTQDAQPAVVFVNGEFYGLNSIRERYDRHYFERRRGIQEADFEMFKNGEITDGDTLFFHEVTTFVAENDLSDDENFEMFDSMVNTKSLRDIFAGNIFIRNTDWLPNNTQMFRNSNPVDWPDNRWEFLVVDLDRGWLNSSPPDAVSFNLLSEIINGSQQGGATVVTKPGIMADFFRASIENEKFRIDFINRFADLMNTLFLPERCMELFDAYAADIGPYMPEHRLRWHNSSSVDEWNEEFQKIQGFNMERPFHQRNHLVETFDLDGQFDLELDVSDTEHGYIRINTVDINPATAGVTEAPYPWAGIYFKGVPVEVTAVPYPGFQFIGWEGDSDVEEAQLNAAFDTDEVYLKALFAPDDSPQAQPLHYWHFNDLTENLRSVRADASVRGTATVSYPGSGDGYMDDVDDGSEINVQFDHPPGKGLRVRNPADERALVIFAPTSGFEDISISYAAKRTNNGSDTQEVYYRTQPDGPWIFLSEEQVFVDYLLYEFDLTEANDVADNPDFALRILFTGETVTGGSGNNRFDNLLISGTALPEWQEPLFELIQGNFTFDEWQNDRPPGDYPDYMRFYWSEDPTGATSDEFAPGTALYDCGYDLDTRPRINGLGEEGFSFISTTNPQFDYCSGDSAQIDRYVGSAVIGLNTQGAAEAEMAWTARLITEGARIFAVRPQYRTGNQGNFQDFETNISFSTAGREQGDTARYVLQFPAELLDAPEVQIRFLYYHVDGLDGNRPEIAVDDIVICPCSTLSSSHSVENNTFRVYPNPATDRITLDLSSFDHGETDIVVVDLIGKTALRKRIANDGNGTFDLDVSALPPGMYLIRAADRQRSSSAKIVKH